MLDTIRFFAPVALPESVIASTFSDVREHVSINTGEIQRTGMLRGLRVKISPCYVIGEGSIAKFGQGHNFFGLRRSGDVRTIEELCEVLHTRPEHVQLRRLDMGTSITLSEPVSKALTLLADCPRFIRNGRPGSVTYTQKQHVYRGYNKVVEIQNQVRRRKIQPEVLPIGWSDLNAIRLESSLLRNIKGQLRLNILKGDCITLADIMDRKGYERMVEIWISDYSAIQKQRIIKMNGKPAYNGTRAMSQYLECCGLKAVGADKLLAAIQNAPDKKNRQRMREKVRRLGSLNLYTEESPLIGELDGKVKEAADNALDG